MTDSRNYRIIPRAEWGATEDNGAGPAPLPALEVWLHHSVTIAPDLLPPFDDDYAAIRTLEQIGESRFGRGMSYTFPITPAGLIFEGHSVDRKGSHTANRNSVARGIVLVGNYETTRPTEAQLDAVAWLLVHGWLAGWWIAAALAGGHRDLKQTACPGQHAYDAMPEIDRRAKALADHLFAPEVLALIVTREDPDMARIIQHPNGTQALVGPGPAMTVLKSTTETEALIADGSATPGVIVLPDPLIWDTRVTVAKRAGQYTGA